MITVNDNVLTTTKGDIGHDAAHRFNADKGKVAVDQLNETVFVVRVTLALTAAEEYLAFLGEEVSDTYDQYTVTVNGDDDYTYEFNGSYYA